MNEKKEKKDAPIGLRVRQKLKDELDDEAWQNRTSLNSYITEILEGRPRKKKG